MARLHYIEDPTTKERRGLKVGDQPCANTSCALRTSKGCGKRHTFGVKHEKPWGDWNCPGFIGKPQPEKKICPRMGKPPKPTKITKGQQAKLEVDL